MSEQTPPIKSTTPNLDKQAEPVGTKTAWCEGFIKGVASFPQGFFATGLYSAHAVLNDPVPDFPQFSYSELSAEQKNTIALASEPYHEGRDIKIPEHLRAADDKPYTPSAGSIQRIWNTNKRSTILRVAKFARMLSNNIKELHIDSFNTFEDGNVPREVFPELKKIVQIYIDVLESPEGKAIAREYRNFVVENNRNIQSGGIRVPEDIGKRIDTLVYQKLLNLYPENKYPNLAAQLSSFHFNNDWAGPLE